LAVQPDKRKRHFLIEIKVPFVPAEAFKTGNKPKHIYNQYSKPEINLTSVFWWYNFVP